MADKDTGVIVAPEDVINDILPFCAQGVEGRDMLSQAAYTADLQRGIGHQPGIARQELANKQARQTSHIASGLAQFLARRYAPGVKDDGDLDRVESALVSVILDLLAPRLPGLATLLQPGLIMPDGTTLSVDNTGRLSVIVQQQMDPIGGIRFFEDEMPRPGYVECNAGLVTNFSEKYPQMAAYLESPYGQSRLVSSLAEYEALHTAIWHTNADGTTVGWQGIGGVAKFWWDRVADILKMPDLQDMFQGAAGPSLGVGDAQGDVIRNIKGTVSNAGDTGITYASGSAGAFKTGAALPRVLIGNNGGGYVIELDPSCVVPTGSANAPRRWGALACAYMGQPAL